MFETHAVKIVTEMVRVEIRERVVKGHGKA